MLFHPFLEFTVVYVPQCQEGFHMFLVSSSKRGVFYVCTDQYLLSVPQFIVDLFLVSPSF